MTLYKNSSIKLSILITVFIVISLSGCFSNWQGDSAQIVISFGGAGRKVYDPEDTDTHNQLEHEVVLTSGTKKLTFNKSGMTFETTVAPGEWNITVNSWIDGEIYAKGSINVILKPGFNSETIELEKVFRWWAWDSSDSNTIVTITPTDDRSGYDVTVNPKIENGNANLDYNNWASQFGRIDDHSYSVTAGKTYKASWKWQTTDDKPFNNVTIRYAKEDKEDGSGDNYYVLDTDIVKFTIPVEENNISYVFTMPDNCLLDISFFVGGDIGRFRIWDLKVEEIKNPSSTKIFKFIHSKGDVGDDGDPYDNWIASYYIPPSVRGDRITAGDVFIFTYSFNSDIAINNILMIRLLDNSNGWKEINEWNPLSDIQMSGIPANTIVSGTIIFTANETASSSAANANRLSFMIDNIPEMVRGPTLTFTEFSLIKAQTAQGGNLKNKLDWISSTNPQNNTAFIITVTSNERLAPYPLSYSNKKVSVILKGDTLERTVNLSSNGSLFTINSGVTLILDNNITLIGRESNNGSLISIVGGKLIMNEGAKITGNTFDGGGGGGVFVGEGSIFTMNGGKIYNNHSLNVTDGTGGAGVLVKQGTFTMEKGEISGNTTTWGGGGVKIAYKSTFTMNGGIITGNTASWGSGVEVWYGILNKVAKLIDGGTIYGNTGNTVTANNSNNDNGIPTLDVSRNGDVGPNEELYYNGTINPPIARGFDPIK